MGELAVCRRWQPSWRNDNASVEPLEGGTLTDMLRPIVMTLLFAAGSHLAWTADPFVSENQKWRAEREQDFVGPDGPFTLVASLVPKQGVSSIGQDKTNDLVLPVEKAPPHVGKIDWQGETSATLRLEPGVKAMVEGKPVTQVEVSKPTSVSIGEMTLEMTVRKGKMYVSVFDHDSKQRKEAKPSAWFPIDKRYRIEADWVAYPEVKTIRMADSHGGSREMKNPGYASFMLDAKEATLQGFTDSNGKYFAFFFRDGTSGHETYGSGRFLEADLPKDRKVVLDFNRAYNPSCAFNPLFVCPIPPKENHLTMRLPAGEMNYPGTAH